MLMIEYKTLVLAVPHVLRPCRSSGGSESDAIFSQGQRVGRSERAGETVRSQMTRQQQEVLFIQKSPHAIPVSARMDIDGVIVMFMSGGPMSRALTAEPRPVDRCSGGGRGGVAYKGEGIWGKNSSRLR